MYKYRSYMTQIMVDDRSRGAKEEAERIHEDLESIEDGQLFDNQPVKFIFIFKF